MSTRPFSPVCHTNINNIYSELCQYTENLTQECVPLRTSQLTQYRKKFQALELSQQSKLHY